MAKDRKEMLEIMKAHAVQMRMDADDDGQWITTENGHKVHLNSEGVPDKGNPHVLAAMSGKGGSGGKGSGRSSKSKQIASKMLFDLRSFRPHDLSDDDQETIRKGFSQDLDKLPAGTRITIGKTSAKKQDDGKWEITGKNYGGPQTVSSDRVIDHFEYEDDIYLPTSEDPIKIYEP